MSFEISGPTGAQQGAFQAGGATPPKGRGQKFKEAVRQAFRNLLHYLPRGFAVKVEMKLLSKKEHETLSKSCESLSKRIHQVSEKMPNYTTYIEGLHTQKKQAHFKKVKKVFKKGKPKVKLTDEQWNNSKAAFRNTVKPIQEFDQALQAIAQKENREEKICELEKVIDSEKYDNYIAAVKDLYGNASQFFKYIRRQDRKKSPEAVNLENEILKISANVVSLESEMKEFSKVLPNRFTPLYEKVKSDLGEVNKLM